MLLKQQNLGQQNLGTDLSSIPLPKDLLMVVCGLLGDASREGNTEERHADH